MASEIQYVSPKPVQGFKRLYKEYRRLAETKTAKLPFREGSSLTQPDFETMGISIDKEANSAFWKPADQRTRAALQSALERFLEENSDYLETVLNNNLIYKDKLAEYRSPTMGDAYVTSTAYIAFILQLVEEGVYHNEGLLDASGDNLFQNLRISCMRSDVPIQTHEGFATPGYPHVTIISVQPQLARSRKELLCTEIWTLYHWASKLASRVLHTANHYLPMRLVSLCGYEARVVSAVFNLSNLLSTVKEKGHADFHFMECQIHIEEYRDLADVQGFWSFMEEMVATPCGNSSAHQEYPEQQST